MQCPECNTPNRDDAAFCGVCKRLFRTTPVRSSRAPAPEAPPPGGFWAALLDRLSGRPSKPVSNVPDPDASVLSELTAAFQEACPAFWRSAELHVPVEEPARALVTRGDDPHEFLEPSHRLLAAIAAFAASHGAGVEPQRSYVIVIERQPDGRWNTRCAIESARNR